MSRVSQLELYNDKDVITQILLMKEQVVTGTYKDVSVTDDGAGNLVFVFTDQNDDPTTFTIPVKLISTVTSSQSGSTVTMRITWTDGTHDDYTWTAGGDVTTNTAQTIIAIKTFSASPIIPDTPSGVHAAVNLTYVSKTDGTNNILHTSGDETASGIKTFDTSIKYLRNASIVTAETPDTTKAYLICSWTKTNNHIIRVKMTGGSYGGNLISLIDIVMWSNGSIPNYHVEGTAIPDGNIKLAEKDGVMYLFFIPAGVARFVAYVDVAFNYYSGASLSRAFFTYGGGTGQTIPVTPDYDAVYDGVNI